MDDNYTDADANNLICEATRCFEKATNNIPIKVGNLGIITLLLCSNCLAKFHEVEQT